MRSLVYLLAGLFPILVSAQPFTVNWFKVAGGGGTSTNVEFTVSGTFGQHDAGGPMAGGGFAVVGGFWSLLSTPAFDPNGLPPELVAQPQDQAVIAGTNQVSLSAAVSGPATMFYQWQHNRVNLTDDEFVSGATTPTLNFLTSVPGYSGDYRLIVVSPYGSVTSSVVIVKAPATAISAGSDHSVFLQGDGSLWAMGYNLAGQLGDGTTSNTNRPEQIVASGVTAVAAGRIHTLFLKNDGSLWAMGFNGLGQLGDGTTLNTNRPEQIVASGGAAIATGGDHNLFLKNDGSLWAMGDNLSGQLGDGTTSNTNRPEQIVASGVTAIAAGGDHSLILKNDGSLWAMGYNFYGQLGDGTTSNTNRPEQIVASGVAAIAAGGLHSLFLKSDGSLWAMGYNAQGQLGDGAFSNTNRPELIVASGATAIAAGGNHSLFLKNDGSLWAMGYNFYGQLGDGTTSSTNRPKQIVPSGVTAIATGGNHSLFLKNDGSLWAMGNNVYGQLGDGTSANVLGPEQIWPPLDLVLKLNASSLTLDEGGSTATNAGSFSDPGGNSNVVFTATAGSITKNDAASSWNWNSGAVDGPLQFPVTVTASNTMGKLTQVSFQATITNVPPKIQNGSFPLLAPGSTALLSILATDAAAADQAAGFTWTIDYGDGTNEIITTPTPAPLSRSHQYATAGSYSIQVAATDKDGGVSAVGTFPILVFHTEPPALPPFNPEPGFSATFGVASNTLYQILASSDLKYWEPLFLSSSLSNGLLGFVDMESPRYPHRFYKPTPAPTPPLSFGKSLGGFGSDFCRAVVVDAVGNSYVWGNFQFTINLGGGNITSQGPTELFEASYSSSGIFLKQRRYGGTGAETLRAVALDEFGNMFVTGTFTGVGDFRETSTNPNSCKCGAVTYGATLTAAGNDIFLARYNSMAGYSPCAGNTNGVCVWARRISGSGAEFGNSIATDASGNVYLAGSFNSAVDFGGSTALSSQGVDSFLAKYGPDGQYLWARNFSSSGDDQAAKVAMASDGNVIIAGTYKGTHQLASLPIDSTSSSFFIAKIGPGAAGSPGNIIWSRNATFNPGVSNAVAAATALSLDAAGNVYVSGYFNSGTNSLGMVLGNNPGWGDATATTNAMVPHRTDSLETVNPFVAKYSPNGACLWVKLLEAPVSGKIVASCLDSMGFLNVTGTFQDWLAVDGTTVTNSNPRYNAVFVSGFSQSGVHQRTRIYGGTASMDPADIAATQNGGLIVVGSFKGTATLGPITTNSVRDSIDGFMIKINLNEN